MKELSFNINTDTYKGSIVDIEQYLDSYDRTINIYDDNYTADWLLSDIHSSAWLIKTNKTVIEHDGTIKYAESVRWDRVLPNGSKLTDDNNQAFKELIQKLVFLSFVSPALNNSSSLISLTNNIQKTMVNVAWVYHYARVLKPNKSFLANITQARLVDLVTILCTGGSFSLLNTAERILSKYSKLSGNIISSKDVFNIKTNERGKIIKWLKNNDLYTTNTCGQEIIHRQALCKLLGISKVEMYPHKATLFLRQFEPDILSYNKHVLVPSELRTEYPTHRTPLSTEVKEKKFSYTYALQQLSLFKDWTKLKPLFPNKLPNPETLRFGELKELARRLGCDNNITPWIPIGTYLTLLNKSINIVINVGKEITAFYEQCMTEFTRGGRVNKKSTRPNKYGFGTNKYSTKLTKEYLLNNIPTSLEHLNISGFGLSTRPSEKKERFNRLRYSPSLSDLLYVLHGACLIIIASLKPIRINELSSLEYDCLYFLEGDGYWLEHDIEKGGIAGELPTDHKPIPSIAAKAIRLLQKYNDIASEIYPNEGNGISHFLLYGINRRQATSTGLLDGEGIGRCIEIFSDFIEVPIDHFGRRWYANIHELRKSFLLYFFWTFKFSSLDACRWMAGHRDIEHVFRYIESNIPGEEMVEIEASYASQQLRMFNAEHKLADLENIEDLYQDVCKHFNVISVSEITEEDLNAWIEIAIKDGRYSIEIFGVQSIKEAINARIAIRISEAK